MVGVSRYVESSPAARRINYNKPNPGPTCPVCSRYEIIQLKNPLKWACSGSQGPGGGGEVTKTVSTRANDRIRGPRPQVCQPRCQL